ncbi:MAG: isoprenylcysteine carboxylmethyltransferase family protein [Longimicrobiales bacterium]|nr:isoprenylcysteine carboxylmethyltransferase family protein [Longimicrobiales bacterium]
MLALPFLYFSRPSLHLLLVGAPVSLSGLLLRAWAAGCIHKDRELAMGGPYSRLRHPLYVGSFFLGLGLTVAGGRWWLSALFLGLFISLYHRTTMAEEGALVQRFGQDYESYRERVPAFIPLLRPHSTPIPTPTSDPGFRIWLYLRNQEWQAALGALVGFGLLWLRMSLPG